MMGGSGGSGLSSESDDLDSVVQHFIPMIIFGNSALAVLVSDKQFEGLRGSASV